LQCVAVCCSVLRVLQCVAVCCSVLQYVAVCNRCSPHKHITSQVYILGVAMSCSVLQCAAVRCSALQCVSDTVSTCVQILSVVQSVAVCCSVSYCVWDAVSTCVLHLRFASEWVGLFYRSLSCRSRLAEEMRIRIIHMILKSDYLEIIRCRPNACQLRLGPYSDCFVSNDRSLARLRPTTYIQHPDVLNPWTPELLRECFSIEQTSCDMASQGCENCRYSLLFSEI